MEEFKSSLEWRRYYELNASELRNIPWHLGADLSEKEKEMISSSVQTFQLGESSEGRHLLKCAADHAQDHDDPQYLQAVRLFIKEEQRHAMDLGKFLKLNGIPLSKTAFTDSVFRKMRHLANLEQSIAVLLTAEIIAQVYYPALLKATQSKVLKSLCEQIISDEDQHVRFQAQRLIILRKNCPFPRVVLAHFLHRLLFWATCLAVWPGHAKVFKAAGLSFYGFLQSAGQRLEHVMGLMSYENIYGFRYYIKAKELQVTQ